MIVRSADRGALLEYALDGEYIGVLLQELAVAAARPKVTSDNGSVAKFETTLQDTSANRNKRLYTEAVLTQAIMAPSVQERLRTNTLVGEANHPFVDDLKRQMVVDFTRVSHVITEIAVPRNGIVRGKVETAATRVGRDIRGLLVENGLNLAFSMRGMGGVRRVPGKDLVEVTSPLALVTYDIVTYPSHQSAYMDALNEGYMVPVRLDAATAYACDQSINFKALTEQLELGPVDDVRLTPDHAALVVRSGQTIVASFLEKDIRQDFRRAILR